MKTIKPLNDAIASFVGQNDTYTNFGRAAGAVQSILQNCKGVSQDYADRYATVRESGYDENGRVIDNTPPENESYANGAAANALQTVRDNLVIYNEALSHIPSAADSPTELALKLDDASYFFSRFLHIVDLNSSPYIAADLPWLAVEGSANSLRISCSFGPTADTRRGYSSVSVHGSTLSNIAPVALVHSTGCGFVLWLTNRIGIYVATFLSSVSNGRLFVIARLVSNFMTSAQHRVLVTPSTSDPAYALEYLRQHPGAIMELFPQSDILVTDAVHLDAISMYTCHVTLQLSIDGAHNLRLDPAGSTAAFNDGTAHGFTINNQPQMYYPVDMSASTFQFGGSWTQTLAPTPAVAVAATTPAVTLPIAGNLLPNPLPLERALSDFYNS